MTVAVGIPCYKAHSTLDKCLASIYTQTKLPDTVYIANDNPEDNEGSYDGILSKYADKFNIKFLTCEENKGPGVARNRALEACTEDFITFIDADDIFMPSAIELLLSSVKMNVVVSQAPFLMPVRNAPKMTQNGPDLQNIVPLQFNARNDIGHPWVFGRMYNVKYLKENEFNFSELRQMEDGYLNACIRMSIEGTSLQWVINDMPAYIWSEGSEHSITRVHTLTNEIPVYNYGSCAIGADLAFKMAFERVSKRNPFNPAISRTAAEMMVDKYFRYYEVLENYKEFSTINDLLSIYWYRYVFKVYARNVEFDVLEQMYLHRPTQFKHIPDETFKQWFDRIKHATYSKDELLDAINALPDDIQVCQKLSGCHPYEVVQNYM